MPCRCPKGGPVAITLCNTRAGYYVAGRGLGESDVEWAEIVAQVKLDLPPQKPLFVCGVGGPRDIVSNVKLGFDVLETRSAFT